MTKTNIENSQTHANVGSGKPKVKTRLTEAIAELLSERMGGSMASPSETSSKEKFTKVSPALEREKANNELNED